MWCVTGSNHPGFSWANTTDLMANSTGGVRTVDGVAGALASNPSYAGTTTNVAPYVFIRAA
jgi:hypothetical protein